MYSSEIIVTMLPNIIWNPILNLICNIKFKNFVSIIRSRCENKFWFFPDVTMKEVGLGNLVKDASSDRISFQNYYSSHNFFSNGSGIWFGMVKMWDTSWKAKDGKTAIVVSDIVNNNCNN